jgi:hypothetical protein
MRDPGARGQPILQRNRKLVFIMPGLVRTVGVKKPATKERKGTRSPARIRSSRPSSSSRCGQGAAGEGGQGRGGVTRTCPSCAWGRAKTRPHLFTRTRGWCHGPCPLPLAHDEVVMGGATG